MSDAPALESLFLRFRERGDARALATVFDCTASELGRVASYLSGGDHARAEDLLQHTWLTAITRAATWDSERPLLPWLLGVLANHARSAARAQRRQVPGGEVLANLLASDDPLRASADGEFAQLLAKGLGELPSPFREAVTLHVQHGLTAVEIGEALGRPAGTVRTQIVRGLDRLRALLPIGLATVGVGGAALPAQQLARVRGEVLARLGPPLPSGSLARVLRWSGALVTLAAAVMLAVLWRPDELASPAAAASEAAAPLVAEVVANDAPRETVALPAASAAVPAQGPQERRPRRITVHVRHEDEPKVEAGERVGLLVGDEVRFAVTDAQGDAVFDDVSDQLMYQVFVSGTDVDDNWWPRPARPSFRHEMTLLVPATGVLTVTVVDAAGRPVAGAEVDGNGSQHGNQRWCSLGCTGSDGTLRRRGQTPRGAQLRARAAGHAVAAWQQAEVHEDGTQSCRLQLAPAGQLLRGRVVDANGKPVAAELGTIAFASDLVEPWYDRTAADGTFAFDWLPNGHVAIVARALVGGRRLIGMVRVDVPSNGLVELRVGEGARLEGATKFADGAPGGGSQVSLRLLADGAFAVPFAQHTLRSGGGGVFSFADVLPGTWLASAEIGNVYVEQLLTLRAGETTSWDAVAAPAKSLRIRLRDERGEPLAKWNVKVTDDRGFGGNSGITGDDGVTLEYVQWRFPADRPLTLALFDPAAHEFSPYLPCWRVPGIVADGSIVDVVVPDHARATHTIRGLVVDENDQPLRAHVMVVSQQVWWDGPRATCDGNGAFAIGPFAPGRVRVVVTAPGRATLRLTDVEVPTSGDAELGTIRLGLPAKVRAVAADGASVPDDLDLALAAVRGGETFELVRQRDGSFTHEQLPPGDYQLLGSSSTHQVLPQRIGVAAAAEPVPVAFQLRAAPALRVVVELSVQQRAQIAYSATLTVRDHTGAIVLRREIGRMFHGRVDAELHERVALPKGDYSLELDDRWQPLRAKVTVGDDGGGVRFVLRE
ncbi:MAG: sigma-70 family RNA polymerase sigma factor [Planctomycetota bacterium]|jgi:RNA polymerase sigma factor (sigma-70 family)